MTQPVLSRQPEIFDAPVSDPDHDLLGIKPYAERLADFVDKQRPPFTIGVYGAWGAGKTSFVNLLKAALEEKRRLSPKTWPELQFISLNAWPFKTSDDLWRALVQRIAYDLHGVTEPPPPPAAAPPAPWPTRIGRLLRRPAVRFHPEAPQRGQFDDYYDLLDRIGDTAYGGPRRPKPYGSALDDEAAIRAVLQGTVAALGSLSPLLGAVRGFFGFGDKVDAAQLLRQEKNETNRNRIVSVLQFQEIMESLFRTTAKGKLVCVFIDDLDRVMPDVAIDLLEALKVFLGKVECIFIVAADAQLMGEGLRMRYKELLAVTPGDQSTVFARKGKEYFEKIIQLGIRVPEPGSGDIHRFLAAQFPQWLPATDLIQAAVGTNPRRLKQYCTWLSYKYMVARDPEDMQDDSPLLNKLIELRSWSPEVAGKLRELAGEADFQAIMERLEKCLSDSEIDQPRPTAQGEVDHEAALEIYQAAVMSTPLQRLFTTEPLLSQCDADEVAVLASFADVVPEPGTTTMLRSGDRVLMRILEKVTRTGVPPAGKILADDLTKLFLLEAEDPTLPQLLQTLADDHEWQELTYAVESALEAPAGSPAAVAPAKALPLLQLATASESLRRLLLEPQRLSAIPREVVLRWLEHRGTIPVATAAARAAHLRAQLPPAVRTEIETGFNLRIRAARHFIKRRKFVKLDALGYSWPEFAELLRKDLPGLKAFESNVVDPDQKPQDLPPAWQTYYDEKLNAFLRLRPLLRDIYADELGKYLKVSNAVVATPQEPAVVPPGDIQLEVPAAAPLSPKNTAEVPLADLAPPAPYVDVDIVIAFDEKALGTCTVVIDSPFTRASGTATFDPARVDRFRGDMAQLLRGGGRANAQAAGPTRSPDLTGRLRDLGQELYRWFFEKDTHKTMLELLGSGSRYRFRLHLPVALTWLPWELLCVPAPFKLFLGLTNRYSLVRRISTLVAPEPRPLSPPLRILAMFASPGETGALKLDEEEKLLRRVLRPAMDRGRVTLDVLRGREATHIALQQKLRESRPHVFHFAGHGVTEEGSEGSLVFDSESGAHVVSASDVATLLRDARVALAVLSGCDTGRAGTDDSTSSVAGALNQAGVPMVIGTTRDILDEAGLLFARDFYQALIDGYTVEASLIEARKAQSVEKWDWSAFALFTTGTGLDDLRLDAEERAAAQPA